MMHTTLLDRSTIVRRGQRLEYFTIGWNLLEGLAAVIAGAIAGSISLVGFGIDSFIEVTSGCAILWRMAVDSDVPRRQQNERHTLKSSVAVFWRWPPTSRTNPQPVFGSNARLSIASPASSWPALRSS